MAEGDTSNDAVRSRVGQSPDPPPGGAKMRHWCTPGAPCHLGSTVNGMDEHQRVEHCDAHTGCADARAMSSPRSDVSAISTTEYGGHHHGGRNREGAGERAGMGRNCLGRTLGSDGGSDQRGNRSLCLPMVLGGGVPDDSWTTSTSGTSKHPRPQIDSSCADLRDHDEDATAAMVRLGDSVSSVRVLR